MNFTKTLILTIFLLLSVVSAKANHVLGGHFSYTCLGGNSYELTLTYYSDCFGATTPPAIQFINFNSAGNVCAPYTSIMNFVSETDISDIQCASELAFTSCNGGIIPGTTEIVYSATVTLDPACDWNISWSAGDYNYFANTNNTALNQVFFDANIDATAPCDPSLEPTSMNVPYYCSGDVVSQMVTFNNPNGYDLTYSLVTPEANGGAPIPGFFDIPGIAIDAITGEITFTSPITAVTQSYMVGVEVTYSSGGSILGTYIETMAFVIRNCQSSPTVFSSPATFDHSIDLNVITESNFQACVGDSINFYISAENSNIFTGVTLTASLVGTPFEGAQFTTEGVNPTIGYFSVLATLDMIGSTTITFNAVNSACINPTSSSFDITLDVSPNLVLSVSDTLLCASLLLIEIEGSDSILWEFLEGTNPGITDNDPTQSIDCSENYLIQVSALDIGLLSFCNIVDTIEVNTSLNDVSAEITNESCAENDGDIDLTIGTGSGNYTYLWTPTGITDQDLIDQPGGDYSVYIEDVDLGCSVDLDYTIEGVVAPSGDIPETVTICAGDCYDIPFNFSGTGPFTIELFDQTAGALVAGIPPLNIGDTFNVCPTENTTYVLQQISDNNNPSCTYDVPSTLVIIIREEIEVTIPDQAVLCDGEQLDVIVNIEQAGFFNMFTSATLDTTNFTGGSVVQFVVNVPSTEFCVYYIEYQDGPTCPNDIDICVDLEADSLPSIIFLDTDPSFCLGSGTPPSLDIEFTGGSDGDWTVELDNNPFAWIIDEPIELDLLLPTPPTENGTITYCITNIINNTNGCENTTLNECIDVDYTLIPEGSFENLDMSEICAGEAVEFLINLAGGQYNVTIYEESTGNIVIEDQLITNFETVDIFPSQTENYIISLFDPLESACNSLAFDTLSVAIYESIDSLFILDTICNQNGETYQLIFDLFGGEVNTYDVTGLSTQGTFATNTFTSENVLSGSGAQFDFTDGDPCNYTYASGIITCPTISFGGAITMDTTFCQTGSVCITTDGNTILDNNDVLSYAILSSNDPETALILAISDVNCWDVAIDLSFPPFIYDTEYFGYVVVGNNDGTGIIDPANTNYFSNGIPFTIYEEPIVSLADDAAICAGDSSLMVISFPGGQPLTSIDIMLDGALQETLTNISSPYDHYVFDAGVYTVQNINTAHCTGSSTDQITITITELPTAIISPDAAICQGEIYNFDVTLTGIGDWDVVVENPDGSTVNQNYGASGVFSASIDGEYNIISVLDNGTGCSNLDTTSLVYLTVNAIPLLNVPTLDSSYCSGQVLNFPVELEGQSQWIIDYTFNAIPSSITSLGNDSVIYIPVSETGILVLETLTDGNSCELNPALAINFTEIETPVSDPGADISLCSGTSQLIGTPENPNFTYLWTQDVQILNQVDIAEPTVLFENISGADQIYDLDLIVNNFQCTDTTSIAVTVEFAPNVDAGLDINLCLGDNVNLNGSGGTCQWNEIGDIADGTFIDPTTQCDAQVSPIITTSYSLLATGMNTCTASDSITVTVSEEFVLDIVFSDSICFGICDGSIITTPSGGFGNYSVDWTNPITLTDLTEEDLCSGTYSFTVSDEGLVCSIDTTITISERDEYFSDLINAINPTCFAGFNSDNGSIEAISTTGEVYYLDNVEDDNNDGLFTGLTAGDYIVQIEDENGCLTSDNVSLISDSPLFTATPNILTDTVCFEDEVIIIGNSNGGSGVANFTWYNCFPDDNTCLFDADADNQATVLVTEDVIIYLIGIDELGCNSDTTAIELSLATPLVIDCGNAGEIEICQNDSIVLNATPDGGEGTYEINWFENGDLLGDANDYVVFPMSTSLYTAELTDGCSAPVSCIINAIVHEQPNVPISADTYSGCFPVEINISKDNPVPNDDILTNCIWNLGNGETQAVCADITHIYDVPGTYTVSLIVTSNEGCVGINSLPQPVVIHGYPFADFDWTPEEITPLENEAQFINQSVGGELCSWTFSGLLQTDECDPYIEFPPGNIGEYDVCLIVTSPFGCRDTTCKVVDITNQVILYVPSAFTPDLDGVNDFFKPIITGIDPTDYLFQIIDRWGTIIFETNDPDVAWRGDNRTGEYYVEPQTFNYMIRVSDIETGDENLIRGIVTVVR